MKALFLTLSLTLLSAPVLAEDYVSVKASGTVSEVSDRFVTAVEGAGAKVFARVPHSKGAASVDMELQDAELIVFGNPKLGTPALQQDIRAGLVLPLRVLVHDEGGTTMLTYESVDSMFEGFDIAGDAKVRKMMSGALSKLTTAAAGN